VVATFDGARLARVAGGPDGQIFVATTETLPTDTTPGAATMRALSATDGSQRWSLGFERIADVAVTPSHVYVIANGVWGNGVMFAFSTTCASENGCVDWLTAWENRKPTNIAAAGDVVYVALADPFPDQQPPHVRFGFLEAWPAAGCGDPTCPDPLVRLSTDGLQPSELAVSGGRVYLVDGNGGPITELTSYALP
jgi:hypothetical protein